MYCFPARVGQRRKQRSARAFNAQKNSFTIPGFGRRIFRVVNGLPAGTTRRPLRNSSRSSRAIAYLGRPSGLVARLAQGNSQDSTQALTLRSATPNSRAISGSEENFFLLCTRHPHCSADLACRAIQLGWISNGSLAVRRATMPQRVKNLIKFEEHWTLACSQTRNPATPVPSVDSGRSDRQPLCELLRV